MQALSISLIYYTKFCHVLTLVRGRSLVLEQEPKTSSAYFKPKPGKVYMIKMDPQNDKIVPIENERFKEQLIAKPIIRIQCHYF